MIEIPDETFRQAKSLAGAQGISLKRLFTEALEEKLRRKSPGVSAASPPWMKLAGVLAKRLPSELRHAASKSVLMPSLTCAIFERTGAKNSAQPSAASRNQSAMLAVRE